LSVDRTRGSFRVAIEVGVATGLALGDVTAVDDDVPPHPPAATNSPNKTTVLSLLMAPHFFIGNPDIGESTLTLAVN